MERITIEQLKVAGFRAFLQGQTFQLASNAVPQSLAVFAPNARGKSSLVDALEFFFSDDGTLQRLGQRRSGTQAGREALAHVNAEQAGVESRVEVSFREGEDIFEDVRACAQADTRRPPAAEKVVRARQVDFIIRGHQLRRFVVDQSPQERYEDVSAWLGLASLANIEENLRKIRLGIQREIESPAARDERVRDLARATDRALLEWDEPMVLRWINQALLAPLDKTLVLSSLSAEDGAYLIVQGREEEEKRETGLAVLKQVVETGKAVYSRDVAKKDAGALIDFEDLVARLTDAKAKELEERGKAEKAVFKKVWEAASTVFANPSVEIKDCPVCATPLVSTAKGGREHVSSHLREQLHNLRAYHEAEQRLGEVNHSVNSQIQKTRLELARLQGALKGAGFEAEVGIVQSYSSVLQSWVVGEAAPDAVGLKEVLGNLVPKVEEKCSQIEARRGERRYGKVLIKLDELLRLRRDLEDIEAKRFQLKNIHAALEGKDRFVAEKIRGYIQGMINTLQDKMQALYKAMQMGADDVPHVYLQLSRQTRQPQLNLLIDFSPTQKGVVPSGYFSDSQIHTLALSLRLAAIKMFNRRAPIVVLDDVVTSYDADHRRAIAGMLANLCADLQIILVTHDERFFAYLMDQLPQPRWIFKRIIELDPHFGPRLHDHRVADALVEGKLARGESSANEIRQAEEEWLVRICRDFGVDLRIREVHRPYTYERSELAIALHKLLKGKKINVPEVVGVSNPFLLSLHRGEIENFGSHFQDNPQGYGSIGDERRRWTEFKEFRDLFRCPGCGSQRFKRPVGMERPVCKKCEVRFAFREPPS